MCAMSQLLSCGQGCNLLSRPPLYWQYKCCQSLLLFSYCCLVSQIVIYVDGFHTRCYAVPSARQHSLLLYLLVSALFQINKIIANVRGELSLPNLRIE